MPIYEHVCDKCNYEWEDLFSSYKSPVPEGCPKCKTKGKVRRVLSICAGKVELNARETATKAYAEGKQLVRDAKKSENLMANLTGEDNYHKQQLRKDKLKKEEGKT